jgi:peptidoglycan glycosyltransferase/penicillin-binding protein 2
MKSAAMQRLTDVLAERSRGDITDRNGVPLTNRIKKAALIIEPYVIKTKPEDTEKVRRILNIDPMIIKREFELGKEPFVAVTDDIRKNEVMKLGIKGISAVNYLSRYGTTTLARHLLGYLNGSDGTGASGIDRFYEDVLKADGSSRVVITTDALHNRVEGQQIRIIKPEKIDERLNVKLTIDYNIQKIVEASMANLQVTGAVVVQNVCTGEIVAMASKPDFDQNNVSDYLNNEQEALFNRAVASYNPGSIFKLVDAVYILENNFKKEDSYFCTGSIDVEGNTIKCSSYEIGGHGYIGLEEAFAKSCNTYFINALINHKSSGFLELAKKLGFGSITGIEKQGVPEAAGSLVEYSQLYNDCDLANLAIGQKGVMATPVQIADLVSTIANGGIKNNVIIVDSITNQNGEKIRNIGTKKGVRVMSKAAADSLKVMMEEVTAPGGTGFRANLDRLGGSAGKTGSAETSKYLNGEKVVNAWFAGYFPRKNPKYSIAVLVENGVSGSSSAAPVFADIAEKILSRGL